MPATVGGEGRNRKFQKVSLFKDSSVLNALGIGSKGMIWMLLGPGIPNTLKKALYHWP